MPKITVKMFAGKGLKQPSCLEASGLKHQPVGVSTGSLVRSGVHEHPPKVLWVIHPKAVEFSKSAVCWETFRGPDAPSLD